MYVDHPTGFQHAPTQNYLSKRKISDGKVQAEKVRWTSCPCSLGKDEQIEDFLRS